MVSVNASTSRRGEVLASVGRQKGFRSEQKGNTLDTIETECSRMQEQACTTASRTNGERLEVPLYPVPSGPDAPAHGEH